MALLTRDAILSAQLPYQDVLVPEWGGEVRVQQMSVGRRAFFFETIRQHHVALQEYEADQKLPVKKRKNVAAPPDFDQAVLAMTLSIVDEQGKGLFEPSDMPRFLDLSHTSVERLWEATLQLDQMSRANTDIVNAEKKG